MSLDNPLNQKKLTVTLLVCLLILTFWIRIAANATTSLSVFRLPTAPPGSSTFPLYTSYNT